MLSRTQDERMHSPPSGLRTSKKSFPQISFWSPRSCKDKDKDTHVRGCLAPLSTQPRSLSTARPCRGWPGDGWWHQQAGRVARRQPLPWAETRGKPPHRHPWGLHCLHPAPSKCPGKAPGLGAPEHPCQRDSSPGIPPAPWGDTGTVTEQGAQGGAGPAHHLMKCTRLFPCSTTNPKGVKAKNAAFPDTSWKATAAPQQSAATPAAVTRHRPPPAVSGPRSPPAPAPHPEHPPAQGSCQPSGSHQFTSTQQAAKTTVPNQFLLLIIKQENGKNLLDL